MQFSLSVTIVIAYFPVVSPELVILYFRLSRVLVLTITKTYLRPKWPTLMASTGYTVGSQRGSEECTTQYLPILEHFISPFIMHFIHLLVTTVLYNKLPQAQWQQACISLLMGLWFGYGCAGFIGISWVSSFSMAWGPSRAYSSCARSPQSRTMSDCVIVVSRSIISP